MPKVSAKQIDRDEKKVIFELQKNSKESIDAIAKKCGFSRQKVWRIIKRLEKNKTIWGYHAVVDNEKFDANNYIVLIKKTNYPITELAEKIINRKIEDMAYDIGVIIECSDYLHGHFDWAINFTAGNIKDAKKFCELLNKIYQNHISELLLIEKIFTVKRCGVTNPNVDRLKEFI